MGLFPDIGFAMLLLAVPGILALAAKYAFGPVPADYHAEIFARAGVTPPAPVLTILAAIYRSLAGALAAVALAIAALAVVVGLGTARWPLLVLAAMALLVGGAATFATLRVERATGVRTPWRPAAGLTVLVLGGALLA